MFDGTAPPAAIGDPAVGEFLRCSMGLSAWKQYGQSRWALRVNPSSGNLHPTEAYVVRAGAVCHYAPLEHALEERCLLPRGRWEELTGGHQGFLVALTSIHWREAWKYGERAFRYCQHDTGHAIGALRFAAALLGWRLRLLPWPDSLIAALLGVDRDADYAGAEREEPECIARVTPAAAPAWRDVPADALAEAAGAGVWHGRANQLSPAHVEWPIIDAVAEATRKGEAGRAGGVSGAGEVGGSRTASEPGATLVPPARTIILQRRSALGFDGHSTLPRARSMSMLRRLQPGQPPWDAIDWSPHVHLLIFVHRVEGLTPGLYAYLRGGAVAAEWQQRMRPEFLWEPLSDSSIPNVPNVPNALFLLLPTDVTWVANRLSCDQDIAGDGFFSVGMVGRVESALREHGNWFYRRLFWEAGLIGQVLYLEAEAAGARATGIGCYYDDPVHGMAGLSGHEWQSLYHLAVGAPVDDGRLTTEPGYPWEQSPES